MAAIDQATYRRALTDLALCLPRICRYGRRDSVGSEDETTAAGPAALQAEPQRARPASPTNGALRSPRLCAKPSLRALRALRGEEVLRCASYFPYKSFSRAARR